jgi:hypothetical protein
MPSRANKFRLLLMLQNCCAVMAVCRETKIAVLHAIVRGTLS